MSIVPTHPIWKRTRKPHHGGAMPEISSSLEDVNLTPRGPDASPSYCKQCENLEHVDSGSSGYLSSPQCREIFFKGGRTIIGSYRYRLIIVFLYIFPWYHLCNRFNIFPWKGVKKQRDSGLSMKSKTWNKDNVLKRNKVMFFLEKIKTI
jgi:hypothetical protein